MRPAEPGAAAEAPHLADLLFAQEGSRWGHVSVAGAGSEPIQCVHVTAHLHKHAKHPVEME